MTNLYQIRCPWTGGVNGPATSTFYTDSGHLTLALSNLGTWWNTVRAYLPSSVTVGVPTGGQIYDDVTGIVAGSWSGGSGTSYSGTATNVFSAASGMHIEWLTGLPVGRRILRGRTFLVPLSTASYDAAGTIAATTVTGVAGAASTLLSASGDFLFRAWHRPNLKKGTPGTSAYVSAYSVPDKVAVLRSRRD